MTTTMMTMAVFWGGDLGFGLVRSLDFPTGQGFKTLDWLEVYTSKLGD
jgi:hypothetical protein